MKRENCVVRISGTSYYIDHNLRKKLSEGWTVKMAIPIINDDMKDDYVDYVLERKVTIFERLKRRFSNE